jgi:Methyltransferase domain
MDEAIYEQTHDLAGEHWWYQARACVIARVMQRYLPSDQSFEILEIGSGAGVNVPLLKAFGSVSAVEMHPGARAKISEDHPDVTVRNGALPDPELLAGKSYGVVGMFDVLEHIAAESESLRAVRDHMTPDGKLFVTVPAYQWLWSRHDYVSHHQRRYTKGSLARALTAAGWEIDQIGYFNTFLFPLAVAARLKDRIFDGGSTTGLEKPRDSVNGLFLRVFKSEAGQVARGGFPFGLSVFAVASPGAVQ